MMERDPLALPGDPDYIEAGFDSDSDLEIVEPKNGEIELEVELVPIQGDDDYLRKRHVKADGTAKAWTKKKMPLVAYDFDVNPESTHLSRGSRYETLQKKKEDFLKVDAVRKQMQKEKQQKHIEKFMEKYKQKRAETANQQKDSHQFISKKTLKKINMLALRMQKRGTNNNRSKDELVKEMVLEFKTDSKKFWEMYKQRLKDLNPPVPMTEERRQMLKERQKMYIMLNKRRLKEDRVSTRKTTNQTQESDDLSTQDMEDYDHTLDYEVDYEEYFDMETNTADEFEAEEESLTENQDFLYFNNSLGPDYQNSSTAEELNELQDDFASEEAEIENTIRDLYSDEPTCEENVSMDNTEEDNFETSP